MRRVFAAIAVLVGVVALGSCAPGDDERPLRVAAAASLHGAFEEIVAGFEGTHPEIAIAPVVYDGSSTLVTQIAEGAPIDVVAVADEATMARIADRVQPPVVFATNSLVIAVPVGTDDDTALEDLADPRLDVVVCAARVPCGSATERALDEAGIDLAAASYEQNVTAVARKVADGIADAGLVYRTDAEATDGIAAVADERLDAIVNAYPIAARTGAGDAADAFVDYVLSDAGGDAFARWGFGTP